MPLLSTSGADTAQGYGFSRGPAGVLTTYTFPSGTSTWTAPANVGQLVTAVGKGANGTADSWGTDDGPTSIFVGPECTPYTVVGATLPWSTFNSTFDSMISSANSVTTSSGGQTYSYTINSYLWCSSNSTWYLFSASSGGDTYRRVGTMTNPNSGNTGNIPTSTYNRYYAAGGYLEVFVPGANGADTTGFGLTFPGGTPSSTPAPTTTFNNVVITPGATYTISNQQSLVITYYA